jgi:hypothetical protein
MQTATVHYATANGSAIAPDDYLAKNGMLTFTPGMSETSVVVTVLRDQVSEPDESFFLRLLDPVYLFLEDNEALGIVRDASEASLFLPWLRH